MHKDNSGLAILNNRQASTMPHKTVVVLGVPRGGTSMMAGVLAKLGVYMGPPADLAPFYENSELASCFKDKNKAKILIARYNNDYPFWGLKVLPKGWYFWLTQSLFQNPVYVVVFRDVLAIAKRRVVSLDKSLLKEMFIALGFNFCLLIFLALTKRPSFLVSYEKALLFPEGFINELAAFLGISNSDLTADAIQFVKPSPATYAMRSTTHSQLDSDARYFGYLDIVDSSKIGGWVLSTIDKNPVGIEILVNGQLKHELTASMARNDVQKSDPRFHESCGFVVQINEPDKLNKGDCVEVKIKENNIHLINSPYIVT